jgi:hypothetical protein
VTWKDWAEECWTPEHVDSMVGMTFPLLKVHAGIWESVMTPEPCLSFLVKDAVWLVSSGAVEGLRPSPRPLQQLHHPHMWYARSNHI